MRYIIGHWGKALDEEMLKSTPWFKVTYSESGRYKNLDGVVPAEAPTKQASLPKGKKQAQNEPAQAQTGPPAPTQSPQQTSPHSQQGNLSVQPKYLAMKLAVEVVRGEAIEIDKKKKRLLDYYELIYGELTKKKGVNK